MGGGPSVLVTRSIYPDAMEWLGRFASVTVPPGERPLARQELINAIAGQEGLLCLLTDRVDAEVMDAAGGSLRVIANYAVGYDNIDLRAATERGIQVTNTPGVLTEATADLTWALILGVARGLVAADRHVRSGAFKGWAPMEFLGRDVHGATLGIVGMGRIGRAVARRACGFGMRVLYAVRPGGKDLGGEEILAGFVAEAPPRRVDLGELLRQSDFVSLHVPLNESTYHLIGREELAMMKPTAHLVNTSRGKVVDEAALVAALKEGRIAGAGLDVFENEPDLAPGLRELDNVILLPHVGSATHETRRKMAFMAVENLFFALQGNRAPNLVNTEVWHGP